MGLFVLFVYVFAREANDNAIPGILFSLTHSFIQLLIYFIN